MIFSFFRCNPFVFVFPKSWCYKYENRISRAEAKNARLLDSTSKNKNKNIETLRDAEKKMRRTNTFKLKPIKKQEQKLFDLANNCARLYNE